MYHMRHRHFTLVENTRIKISSSAHAPMCPRYDHFRPKTKKKAQKELTRGGEGEAGGNVHK